MFALKCDRSEAVSRLLFVLSFYLAGQFLIYAQSQALNGQIEGTVRDVNGAAVVGARVVVANTQTGAARTLQTDENGFYRAPLLPLGNYRLEVEASGFKRLVREGITLAAGQTATVDMTLEPGGVTETVTVSSDAPIADPAKIDLGRVINEREVANLPLVSRNLYNFALLQANVVGRPNVEFGVPRITVGADARRINYQLDGNYNTQSDRAGIRLMPISEVFIGEVQVVTNGFAPEFGNTPGVVFNAVTRAGTNEYRGTVGYRFRRTPFSSRPFSSDPTKPKPETKVDDYTAALGGPIIRDRWHFYAGFERVMRDLAGEPQRVITISKADQAALIAAGVSPNAFPNSIPASQKVNFFIVRTDAQLTDKHRLVGRFNLFRNTSPNNIAGGTTTLERSIDFIDRADSVGLQLVSTFSPLVLNELRYQYARRRSENLPNENSGSRPSILISGIAAFGAPENANTIAPLEVSNQLLDNVTITRGLHTIKFGAGFNRVRQTQRAGVFARYTFPSIAAYVAAKSGANPFSYTQYTETLGDPSITVPATFYQAFVQDDWKATSRLKINYGVRYDLYDVPDGDPNAPLEFSRRFRTDKNNFAPRLGIAYALREGRLPTVLRASAGLYYEQPWLDIYRRALQSNGNPRFVTFVVGPSGVGAPRFPNTLGSLPPGTTLPRQSIEAVSPDYENLVAFHTNLQLEQALSPNLSLTVGFINSRGTHLPVYRNINPINPIGFLADGRPVFSTTVSPTTRLYPQFNNVLMVESVGTSNYTAGTLSLNKRFSSGYQFSANYTYSHAIDDAPEQNLVAATSYVLSDPTNRRRDRGNAFADQRHTFVLSFVGRPTFNLESGFWRSVLNDNQLGIIATANSGETFNITTGRDLNQDGFGAAGNADRPLFIGRNTGRTPRQFNVDLRYTRFVRFSERFNLEVFGEFINVFNINSIVSVNGVVPTNPDGSLTGPLPDFTKRNPVGTDSRQFQLGFKFNF